MIGGLALGAVIVGAMLSLTLNGCGLAYDAGAKLKTSHMKGDLKTGETTLEVHQDWGEPDLRQRVGASTEVWSYAERPNNNDIAATVLYTSVKPGDSSRFLDLKFVDNQLVSWNETEHMMPPKQGTGMGMGFGGPGGGMTPISHY